MAPNVGAGAAAAGCPKPNDGVVPWAVPKPKLGVAVCPNAGAGAVDVGAPKVDPVPKERPGFVAPKRPPVACGCGAVV